MEAAGRSDRLLAGCAARRRARSALARNYDYPAEPMDAVILRSAYLERPGWGVTDEIVFPPSPPSV